MNAFRLKMSTRWQWAGGLLLVVTLTFGWGEPLRAGTNNPAATRFKIPRAVVPGFRPPRPDPADIAVGERLTLETRFSQYFFARCNGDVNAVLPAGDPVMDTSLTTGAPLPGPFAGHAMNCRACHLVAEFRESGRGNRTYSDYARRSPVPAREDGQVLTPRNAPPMVNATVRRAGAFFLHFDGEFTSNEDLARGTLSGRNYGWLADEAATALRHVARVIRDDDGRGPLARDFGGFAYRMVLAGTDPALGEETEGSRITAPYRVDVMKATDGEVVDAVARLISVYLNSLFFSRDEGNEYDSSPYDCFMETNRMPRRPSPGMTEAYYNREIVDHLGAMRDSIWVTPTNGFNFPLVGRFKTLKQEFRFGPQELAGMRIFFSSPRVSASVVPKGGRPGRDAAAAAAGPESGQRGGIGNCLQCHPAPNFTDFKFHNTGASQEEYDSVHGAGAFARLAIPGLAERQADPARWLPASGAHPRALGLFMAMPMVDRPERADLGLWNVFANPAKPTPQDSLREVLAGEGKSVPDEVLLPRTIGLFKTPSLRGLSFSEPYLHTGRKDSIEDMIEFYRSMSRLARAGLIRNGAPELAGIFLQPEDVAPLAAFLRALNEDYE